MAFKDHFSAQSALYTQFRPRYPAELFAYLAGLVPKHDLCWDCGTGNGQAAIALADYFDQVVATDASQNQIAHAGEHPKVHYALASAERCPLADASVDLITVAQAAHWFELNAFYREARRVGRRHAAIALWCYGLATITPEVDAVVMYLYRDILGDYWPPDRAAIELRYQTLAFPFEELSPPSLAMSAEWTLAGLIGYLRTWSSVQQYMRKHQKDPLESAAQRLHQAWGTAETSRPVHWQLYLRIGRVHSQPLSWSSPIR